MEKNKGATMQRHIKREPLKEEEVNFILENIKRMDIQALVVILYWFGCRISEALMLTKGDVIYTHDDTLEVNFKTLKRDKGGKMVFHFRRCLPLPFGAAPFKNYFIAWYNKIADDDTLLFNFSKRIAEMKLQKVSQMFPESTGGQVWAHLFRHTRLQLMANKGATHNELQAWSGHKSSKSLDAYITASPAQLKAAGEKIF